MKKELLSKTEPALNDLGNSQPIQIAKDAKLGGTLLRKCAVKTKPRVWLNSFNLVPGEIRHLTDRFLQPSQQKLGIEIIKARPEEDPVTTGMNAYDIHRRLTKFLRMPHQQKHCQRGLKDS